MAGRIERAQAALAAFNRGDPDELELDPDGFSEEGEQLIARGLLCLHLPGRADRGDPDRCQGG